MTPSQWLDLAVLSVAFVAAVSGWRSGALGSLLSFLGVVLGAVAGVLLAPHVVAHVDGARALVISSAIPETNVEVVAARDRGIAVVLVTHDPGAVKALEPERVIVLPDGDEDLWSDEYMEIVELA